MPSVFSRRQEGNVIGSFAASEIMQGCGICSVVLDLCRFLSSKDDGDLAGNDGTS